MIERTVSRRYATALLRLADQAKCVETVETEILGLAEVFKKSPDFRKSTTHPLIPPKEKKALLSRVLPGIHPLLRQFLDELVEKDRFRFLPDIAALFDDLADEYAGVVRMTVESALPMSEAHKAKLLAKLTRLSQGRKVEVDTRVNPELVGGLRIRHRDTVIDGSVAGRLHDLREKLMATMR